MSTPTSQTQFSDQIILVLDLLKHSQTVVYKDAGNLFSKQSIGPTLPSKTTNSSGRLTLTELLSRGSLSTVYRGSFDGASSSVVVKLVVGDDSLAVLRHEAHIYQSATSLQGTVLPRFYGFYENESHTTAFILMEDCGRPCGLPLEELADGQKLRLMQGLKQMHDAGIEHCDFQPWNVLLDSDDEDSLRIVDWHLARFHECQARIKRMTEEFCYCEAVSELACPELVAIGDSLIFRSQADILAATIPGHHSEENSTNTKKSQ